MSVDMNTLAAEIAAKIADYRTGEIIQPNREHVLRWVGQFDAPMQAELLVETRHFLSRLYVSKTLIEQFIIHLSTNVELTGGNPVTFWSGVGFLDLQYRSQSQRDMLALLSDALHDRFSLNCDRRVSTNARYIYIDDAIFTGNQVLSDLRRWIEHENISDCDVHLVFIGIHKSGFWYARKKLKQIVHSRNIRLHWWRMVEIEDWKKPENVASVSVLWPTHAPDDKYVQRWLAACPDDRERFNPRPHPEQVVPNVNFASENGRELLEQAFLQRGAYIASLPQHGDPHMRPLGYHGLSGPGFGTLLSTYRNCPNNSPLVLWWGHPDAGHPLNQWYPLLPRRTRAAN